MDQLKESVLKTISNIEDLTDLFYKQKNNEGFTRLNNILMQLMNTLEMLNTYQVENNKKYIEMNITNQYLSEAMQALERKDTILLADIFKYDILVLLKNVLQLM